MPICKGSETINSFGSSYNKNPLASFAQQWIATAKSTLNESHLDIYEEPIKVFNRVETREAFREFFTSNLFSEAQEEGQDPLVDDETMTDEKEMMDQQFDNNVDAVKEHANIGDYNPVIGLAFPIQKNILMNMVFDKGAIQKVVADTPKFTLSMEKRILVDTKGNEIDMFMEQNKMTDAIDASNPVHYIDLELPETEITDVLALCGGTAHDDLSISTKISHIRLDNVYIAEGERLPDADGVIGPKSKIAKASEAGVKPKVWFPVNIEFKPGYNEYQRTFVQPISITIHTSATTVETKKDSLSGTMDKNKFNIYSSSGVVKAVRLAAELDTANAMLDTCSVKWDVTTTLIEIPNAIPINTTISPNEVKDLAALYQVNQLTKIMSLFKTALANYKDDKIKKFLDDSYDRLDDRAKGYGEFDFAVPNGYALDHVEHRYKTFFDFFDSQVQEMLYVLNDPDMTVTVFGDPDLVRKITPTEYTYQTPASIGPVTLDYKRTVVTSDRRVYQFIGSDKLRWSDQLICILSPRNSDRVTYRIYDYQMYVSNEIRNAQNPALPSIHAFERWLIQEYQPVQTRIKILNRTGLKP